MSQNFTYRSSRSGHAPRSRSGQSGGYSRPTNNNRFQKRSRQPKKDYIHPSKFVQSAKVRTQEAYVPQHSFNDFDLNPHIKRNLQQMGFKNPSPIQDQAIPHGLSGKDIVGIANTGTGKTGAFVIPIVDRLLSESTGRAVILAPTRELAEQIEEQCLRIGAGSGLRTALLIGGASMGAQYRSLKQNPHIIIGTPGRVKDHLERKSLKLKNCNMIVLDEVDRMLDMGFVNDITLILNQTMPDRQSYYFSATLDARVQGIIERFSEDAVQISVQSGSASDNVEQNIVPHTQSDKLDKLHDILIHESSTKVIIFDDTQRTVEQLSKELSGRGFTADYIHGGKTQAQRQKVLKRFKDSEVTVLVATDVAARGLDVSDISHVINYSLPQTYSDYIHRIGRTGRAGKIGHSLTFVEEQPQRRPARY